jgi:hypothetical protein
VPRRTGVGSGVTAHITGVVTGGITGSITGEVIPEIISEIIPDDPSSPPAIAGRAGIARHRTRPARAAFRRARG